MNKDNQSLTEAYNKILQEEINKAGNESSSAESVRYEHRVVKEYNGGEYYGEPLIFKVGEFLKKTKTPGKYEYYPVTLGHGAGVSVPGENVGVFKITRRVIEDEERVE